MDPERARRRRMLSQACLGTLAAFLVVGTGAPEAIAAGRPTPRSTTTAGTSQAEASPPAGTSLRLLDQTSLVAGGGTFVVSFSPPAGTPVAATQVSVSVYGKLASRSAFDQTLKGNLGPRIASFAGLPLSRLESQSSGTASGGQEQAGGTTSSGAVGSGAAGSTATSTGSTAASTGATLPASGAGTTAPATFTFAVTVTSANAPAPTSPAPGAAPGAATTIGELPPGPTLDLDPCPSSGCSGVYPVTIQLSGDAGSSATGSELVTHMIYLESTGAIVPLGFSWVVPVPYGADPAAVQALAAAFGHGSQVPFDVLAVPQTLARLETAGKPQAVQDLNALSALVAPSGTAPPGPTGTGSPAPTTGAGATSAVSRPTTQSETSPSPSTAPTTSAPTTSTPTTSAPTTSTPTTSTSAPTGTGVPATHELLPSTYVPVDLPSLADGSLVGELGRQLVRGRQVLQTALHAVPSASIWATTGPLDRSAVSVLQNEGASTLVVPAADLTPVASSLTVTQPWLLEGSSIQGSSPGDHSGPLIAVSDSGLETDVSSTTDPVLAAHRVLADLAQVWSDAPNQTDPPRGLVLLSPPDVEPDPAFVTTLLEGLGSIRLVEPMTLSRYFASIPPVTDSQGPVERALATNLRASSLPSAALRTTRRDVGSYASAAGVQNPHAVSLGDQVLSVEADGLSVAQRSRALAQIRSTVRSLATGVVLTGSRTVTLTARTATIPITVSSSIPYPLQVVVSVSSDRLAFPGKSAIRATIASATSTVDFRVTSRVSGAFPLKVTVSAPQGNLVFASASYTVRSTAFSGMAYGLTAAAVAVLIVWWGRSIIRSRRERDETAASDAS